MRVLNLEQGSKEWLEARKDYFCASEAPAMMGASKYVSRRELLAIKSGVNQPEIAEFKKQLFDRGHKAEASVRGHFESDHLETFTPCVIALNTGELPLLASLDGLSESNEIWEHKIWNETLADNVSNSVIEPHYYWQLEHQMLVAGATKAYLTVSDGTPDKMVSMLYTSDIDRRGKLIKGWHQFQKDLADYEPEAKIEQVKAAEVATIPFPVCKVEGSLITTDLDSVIEKATQFSREEMNKQLATDQDFANKEQINKDIKKARARLKTLTDDIQNEFTSYADFAKQVKELDSIFQKLGSHGERQVKEEKTKRKAQLVADAEAELMDFYAASNKVLGKIKIQEILDIEPDFTAPLKNKRTLESMKEALNVAITEIKLRVAEALPIVQENLLYVTTNAEDYKFLFHDIASILSQSNEAFKAVVDSRIATHKQEELARKEAADKRQAEIDERERQAAIDERAGKDAADAKKMPDPVAGKAGSESRLARDLKQAENSHAISIKNLEQAKKEFGRTKTILIKLQDLLKEEKENG